jgi:hypothetical protein
VKPITIRLKPSRVRSYALKRRPFVSVYSLGAKLRSVNCSFAKSLSVLSIARKTSLCCSEMRRTILHQAVCLPHGKTNMARGELASCCKGSMFERWLHAYRIAAPLFVLA